MGLSPGPASTVLRFLRGGCDGCLCGQLCEPCRDAGDSGYSEGTVLRVTPERVVLTDGRVFRRPPGGAPRPGQTVVIDPRPGIVWHGQTHQPRGTHGEETVFVPPTPSYDSPQRPALFGGLLRLPDADEDGEFIGEIGTAPPEGTLLLDDGRLAFLPPSPFIDHSERVVVSSEFSGVRVVTGLSVDSTYVPLIATAVDSRSDQDRLSPYPFTFQGRPYWLRDFVERPGGQQSRDTLRVTLGWDGHRAEEVTDTQVQPGTVVSAKVGMGPEAPGLLLTDYRVWTAWTQPFGGGGAAASSRTRVRYLQGRRVPDFPEWQTLMLLSSVTRPNVDWGDELQPAGSETFEDRTGPLEAQTFVSDWAGSEPPPGLRWRSPDGEVTVEGPLIDDPADLTNATLTAYGVVLQGGTWAGLRDHPVQREDGTWDFDRVVVLHEAGGTVTAVRSDGRAESCRRAVFEAEALRGALLSRFSPVGLGHHSWPPPWAFALCEQDTRALVAWDPWRDARKRRGDDQPASWSWPARPAKRPRTLPASAPRAPLGVTLADVLGPVPRDEPLPRGAAPLRVPVAAEVQRGGQWEASPGALAALAKRVLYAPAGWPEELDDRTHVRGPVRLTWEGSAGEAVLLLRAKPQAGRPLEVSVNGAVYPARRLGHNALEKRGWHPYLVETRERDPTLVLTANAPLSRVLRLDAPDLIEA
ncbi:hypothetical protein [Deinococcus sp. YIM 77859]|uniref:hypothetical protein n=1 Tax=Deinococcus sp. YIM 77859 TaxID=1540221 RepID=UPI000557C84A|nr:hypothetical protein [Deinococcus sp. YIM 77859]